MPANVRQRAEQILDIDASQLDREWLSQPTLYFEFAADLADARASYERAKTERDLVYAEVDQKVRMHPSNYGIDKVTEKTVETAVLKSREFQTASESLIGAKHDLDVLQAAVDAIDHRKRALENLVSLQAQGYFATPREPSHSREKIQDMGKRTARRPRTRAEVGG